MKKHSILLLLLSSFFGANAQEKKSIDTVKTEIVNVITTYNPKIADASKIKRTPELKKAVAILYLLGSSCIYLCP